MTTAATLFLRCVSCNATTKVDSAKTAELPMCPRCFSPMYVVRAVVKAYRGETA